MNAHEQITPVRRQRLRRTGVAAVAMLAASLAATAGDSIEAAPPDPFLGTWVSTDAADGSSQRLSFGGHGATRRVFLFDTVGSACGLENDSAIAGHGIGEVTSPSTIEVDFHLECISTDHELDATVVFAYDSASGTLTDDLAPATTWFRR